MTFISRNVTVDPLSPATPVADPEIAEVIDLTEGKVLGACTFILSHRYDRLVAQRIRIREGLKEQKPLFACALCSTPVYIVAKEQKRFFFRHLVEDGSCPARTREALTEEDIRASKYHGLRESEAHKRIKRLIERSLRADPSFTNTAILKEKRWRSAHDPGRWRQPDVQATRGAQRIAFEAQLSTTFLNVVVERRLFYKKEGALLVWVLSSFDPAYRRMTTDDLLFSNNSNIFVVDEETTRISEETGAFQLRCFYRRPIRESNEIRERWEDKVVPFAELTCDVAGQRAYFFDYQAEEQRLRETSAVELREQFFDFWKVMTPHCDGSQETLGRWKGIRKNFAQRGIGLPNHPSGDSNFRSMIHGVSSALRGEPVGWQFNTLIQVAHHLVMDHPQHLLAFGYALELSGHKATLAAQDITGKWSRKRKLIWERILKREPNFLPDQHWLAALSFLCPEVGKRVQGFLEGRHKVRRT